MLGLINTSKTQKLVQILSMIMDHQQNQAAGLQMILLCVDTLTKLRI